MNRKLIRPNLADVNKPKDVQRDHRGTSERTSDGATAASMPRRTVPSAPAKSVAVAAPNNSGASVESGGDNASATTKTNSNSARRAAPPLETNAKIYYYKKQIDSHTRMIVVLQDNEEIEGTIEWYDRDALKINRKNAPNIMLLERNIKYMYKAED